MTPSSSYQCTQCGHEFEGEGQVRCPRCSCDKVESRFLFGTPSADELTAEDYIDALLALCCGDARAICFSASTEDEAKKEKE